MYKRQLLFAAPIAALDVVLIPQRIDQLVGDGRVAGLALTMALGMVLSFFMNAWIAVGSDHTFGPLGRRTPWIISGALLSAASLAILSVCDLLQLVIVFWLLMQIGYAMIAMPLAAAFGERVPDKFRGTVSGFYGAGIAVGQTLGSFVGAQLLKQGEAGIFGGWMMGMAIFSLTGIVVVLIWPREKSNRDEARGELNVRSMLMSFRPPKNAPDFYYALAGRTMMMGGYWMINTYQLYIAQDYVFAGDPGANVKAAELIATMAVITLVVSLIAAVAAGPITDKIGMRKVPVALASCLFAVGALMPMLFRSATGMLLFAGVAGLGYGIYNAIDQALNVSVLPNPEEAGKDLGILNLANTLSTVIGSGMTSILVVIVKAVMGVSKTPVVAYTVVFGVAIVIVLIAAFLIMRIKNVK